MIDPVQNVLIIGGGFSRMAAVIELRKRGVAVDLVEIDPGWRSYGAGISLGGANLRAFGKENSSRLGELEISGGDKAEQQRILGASMAALAAPI